jgi:hypothetical protein
MISIVSSLFFVYVIIDSLNAVKKENAFTLTINKLAAAK